MQSGDAVESHKATLVPYKYAPLSSSDFRLLVVEGGKADTPIITSLRRTSYLPGQTTGILPTISRIDLKDDAAMLLDWDAISYAWEGQQPSETILVDGQELGVTPNVMGIIKDLRRLDQRAMLWIDAICINQADQAEKNFQVSIMRSIYQNAKRVVIWLGPETFFDEDRTGAALDAVSWLHSKIRTGLRESFTSLSLGERPQFENLFDCYKRERNYEVREILPSLSRNISQRPATPAGSPFETAVQCPWFKRIWVVQEAILAKVLFVQVGSRCVLWREFAIAALRFLTNSEADIALKLNSDDCYTRCFQQQYSGSTKSGISMIYLIETLRKWAGWSRYPIAPSEVALMCKNCQATIPNDKIYAIIGLFGLKSSLPMVGLSVDYNLSAPEVYKDFVAWCIRRELSLDILAQQRYNNGKVKPSPDYPILPSWATDWSGVSGSLNFNTTETNPLGGRLKHRQRNRVDHSPRCRREGDTLIVRGFMIDTIKEPAPPRVYYDRDSQKKWIDSIPEDQEENSILFPCGPHSAAQRTAEKFLDMPYLWRDGKTLSIPRSTNFTRTLLTGKGCLAVTFPYMNYENKPKVCALYGGRALFILQPVLGNTSGTPLYNLVCGDCFIDGFENGKGIQMARRLGLQEMEFRIV